MGLNRGSWLLKKNRFCRNCGAIFLKGSSVATFLHHVKKCSLKVAS